MRSLLVPLILLLAPLAYAQIPVANTVGAALHPVYILLAYTCVPALNELSSFCSVLSSCLLCTPLWPLAIILFCSSGFLTCLTLPIVYGFPTVYTLLGALGGNPNFFIGGLGDLFGHFLVDLGSVISSCVLCLPLGALLFSSGDFITLCGNGLSVAVVGDMLTASQQFLGAAVLGAMALCNLMNVCCCFICYPCSFVIALISMLCTNCVALGTDLLGQAITYLRPACATSS